MSLDELIMKWCSKKTNRKRNIITIITLSLQHQSFPNHKDQNIKKQEKSDTTLQWSLHQQMKEKV